MKIQERNSLTAEISVMIYLRLKFYQPVKSLSSGEKQGLLLMNWLQAKALEVFYILDEPSTGLLIRI